MLAGSAILSVIFIILLIASPFTFKAIFKINSFAGFTIGMCASFVTAAIITVTTIVGLIIIAINSKDINPNENQKEILEALGFGFLLFCFIIVLVSYLAVYFVLQCYTKRFVDAQNPSNAIFMFISGYNVCYIVIFLVILFISLAVNSDTPDTYIYSAFLILVQFLIFFNVVKLAGISIMLMIKQRNSIVLALWCALGVYFGPFLFYFIGICAKYSPIMEYPLFFFDIASIALGSFFYYKYADSSNDGNLVSNTAYTAQ